MQCEGEFTKVEVDDVIEVDEADVHRCQNTAVVVLAVLCGGCAQIHHHVVCSEHRAHLYGIDEVTVLEEADLRPVEVTPEVARPVGITDDTREVLVLLKKLIDYGSQFMKAPPYQQGAHWAANKINDVLTGETTVAQLAEAAAKGDYT